MEAPGGEYTAIMRHVSKSMAYCELTHLDRIVIDVEVAQGQHDVYARTLKGLGYHVEAVPAAEEGLPDAVFVEDVVVVTDEFAIVMHPGAASRRPEVDAVAALLPKYRDQVLRLTEPSTMDGGDVLQVLGTKTILVGQGYRSNIEGINQMQQLLAPYGYIVHGITSMTGCLHLKTAVTMLGPFECLINSRMVDRAELIRHVPQLSFVECDEQEPFGANCLVLPLHCKTVLMGEEHVRTIAKLRALDYTVVTVPASELAKAEGAVTCCCVLIRHNGQG